MDANKTRPGKNVANQLGGNVRFTQNRAREVDVHSKVCTLSNVENIKTDLESKSHDGWNQWEFFVTCHGNSFLYCQNASWTSYTKIYKKLQKNIRQRESVVAKSPIQNRLHKQKNVLGTQTQNFIWAHRQLKSVYNRAFDDLRCQKLCLSLNAASDWLALLSDFG